MKRMTRYKSFLKLLKGSLTTKEWMKTDQVAEYLSTSKCNVRNMVYKGLLFPKKFNGRLYFKKSDIDLLIQAEGV